MRRTLGAYPLLGSFSSNGLSPSDFHRVDGFFLLPNFQTQVSAACNDLNTNMCDGYFVSPVNAYDESRHFSQPATNACRTIRETVVRVPDTSALANAWTASNMIFPVTPALHKVIIWHDDSEAMFSRARAFRVCPVTSKGVGYHGALGEHDVHPLRREDGRAPLAIQL